MFVMDETTLGLQSLAREVRSTFGSTVAGITGSVGKTTTRAMVTASLAAGGEVGGTSGNRNNHLGVPLTILNLSGTEKYIVIEMGANHLHEIRELCGIAYPEIGLITNIGEAHIGEFGSAENIQKGKGELFEWLRVNEGIAVVNLDDEKVIEVAMDNEHKVGYTLDDPPLDFNGAIYAGRVTELDAWSRATLMVEGMTVKLALPGRQFAHGALAAYATAVEAGVDPESALTALATVEPLEGRGRIVTLADGIEVLDDAYNAGGPSIEAALTTLARREGQRIAVLGDVHELGAYEEELHRSFGRMPVLDDIDLVYFVGERMAWAAEEAELMGHPGAIRVNADAIEQLPERIGELIEPGAGIVVKGSRAMRMERVVRGLETLHGSDTEGSA
ncbi:UDP-N-acetylmuramoyl-tripeptide--D-alanyl-D-alanine ligase [bacterium]|nr:UDP-N-acetylmuramoyl-tripeptide--D-alanyl-D-alanine ligase [bacterium]